MKARSSRTVLAALLYSAALSLAAGPSAAFEHTLHVAIDTDSVTSTGCDFSVEEASGTTVASGVERLVVVTVDANSSPPQLANVEIQSCEGGVSGAATQIASGGWPVGLGTGVSGSDVVEFALPTSLLGGGPSLRLYVGAQSAAGGSDALTTPDGTPPGGAILFSMATAVPALDWLGWLVTATVLLGLSLVLLRNRTARALGGVGLVLVALRAASALGLGLDGQVGDWAGTPPVALDALGDSTGGDAHADVAALFVALDGDALAVRIDVASLEVIVCGPGEVPGSPGCDGVCGFADDAAGADCDGVCDAGEAAASPDCATPPVTSISPQAGFYAVTQPLSITLASDTPGATIMVFVYAIGSQTVQPELYEVYTQPFELDFGAGSDGYRQVYYYSVAPDGTQGPAGSAIYRVTLDTDGDGYPDSYELLVGSDPANPADVVAPQAIAVWASVDGQTVAGTFSAGVVAYHQAGIGRVDFATDNGPVTSVATESLNPVTGEMEFVYGIDTTLLSDGQHLLHAIAYPSAAAVGTPRALPDRTLWVQNGADPATTWRVSANTGSDVTGTGSAANPFQTILVALLAAASGDTIELMDGDYHLGADSTLQFDRYVTIRPAQGAVTRIISSDALSYASFLKFENLSFDWTVLDEPYRHMLFGYDVDHIWVQGCSFLGPTGHADVDVNAVRFWGDSEHFAVEGSTCQNTNRFFVAGTKVIVRGNTVGPIYSDAFNFFGRDILISNNDVSDIGAPALIVTSQNAEPFDLSAGAELTLFHVEYNVPPFVQLHFEDLAAAAADPSAASAQEIADLIAADAAFDTSEQPSLHRSVAAVDGTLVFTFGPSSYVQQVYVEGSANQALGFAAEGIENRVQGSGQHADVFQYWSDIENCVVRNNRATDNLAQGLLAGQSATSTNFAFVNNLLVRYGGWDVSFENAVTLGYHNVLFEYNTLWTDSSTLIKLPVDVLTTDFVARNNLLGAGATASDLTGDARFTMDYNLYDGGTLGTPPSLGENSIWTNQGLAVPTPTPLFSDAVPVMIETVSGEVLGYTGDFSTAPSSPARNRASSASGIAYDTLFQPRSDGLPDIGAYEYQNDPGMVTAYIEASSTYGPAPLNVAFDGTFSATAPGATIVSWAWDFGDATTGDGAQVTHSYGTPDSYTVSLTVTDSLGAVDQATKTVLVTQPALQGQVFGLSFDGETLVDYSDSALTVKWIDDLPGSFTTGVCGDAAAFPTPESPAVYVDRNSTNFDALFGMEELTVTTSFKALDTGMWIRFLSNHVRYSFKIDPYQKELHCTVYPDVEPALVLEAVGGGGLLDDQWHHAALVYDGATGTLTCYADGVGVATESGPPGPIRVNEWWTLSLGAATTQGLVGAMDDVRVYNIALAPEEISAIASETCGQ